MKKNNQKFELSLVIFLSCLPLVLIIAYAYSISNGFFYTLDDPYIHLELARNIGTHFHYGININEFSAPSSSIAWPLILAAMAWSGDMFYLMPIIINFTLLVIISKIIYNWLKVSLELAEKNAFIITLTLIAGSGLYWLSMTGMEHMLSVAITTQIAIMLSTKNNNNSFFYTLLIALPLIRYDNLSIVAPLLAYQFINIPSQRNHVIVTTITIAIAIIFFSIFLNYLNLPLLPTSIIAKTEYAQSSLSSLANNSYSNIKQSLSIFMILLAAMTYKRLIQKQSPLILVAALLSLLLHCTFGRIDQARYETYIFIYCLIITLGSIWTRTEGKPQRYVTLILASLILLSIPNLASTSVVTALASKNIRDQQYQIAVISQKYLNEPIAINDLGLVSFKNRNYVLDLYGLASPEALFFRRHLKNNPTWIDSLMKKHNVHYAFLYDSWFPVLPSNFIKVAELVLPDRNITPSSDRVSLYATDEPHSFKLKAALKNYARDNETDAIMLIFKI